METTTQAAGKIVNDIVEKFTSSFKIEGDIKQIYPQIHPIISNLMYEKENSLLEFERFKTLISLSKSLDDENILKAIEGLKYTIQIKRR